MADPRYLAIVIDGRTIDVVQSDEVPVAISYKLEDPDDFQAKEAAEAFDVVIPATREMDQHLGGLHDPNAEDNTPGERLLSTRPATVRVGGTEILAGKALLKAAAHSDQPEDYVFNIYGQNGDWVIALRDKTLWDFLNTATHTFTKVNVEASWSYDGTSSSADFVYAPVRYRTPFTQNDTVVGLMQVRPSISPYWLIRRAFDSIGYRIAPGFVDTPYFRRAVLPWVWGDFLRINSTQAELMRFRAGGPNVFQLVSQGITASWFSISHNSSGVATSANGYIDSDWHNVPNNGSNATFDLANVSAPYGFDNTGLYNWTGPTNNGRATWTYPTALGAIFGTVTGRFKVGLSASVKASSGSNTSIYVEVYKNGSLVQSLPLFAVSSTAGQSTQTDKELSYTGRLLYFNVGGLVGGDTVMIKFKWLWFKSFLGSVGIDAHAHTWQPQPTGTPGVFTYEEWRSSFELLGISIEAGSVVNFKQYERLKSYKVLDLLRGLVDAFNLSPQTDSVNRIVSLEPLYPYALDSGLPVNPGHYSGNKIEWTTKQDRGKRSELEIFSDTEREAFFMFQEDSNDGGLNKIIGRTSVTPGAAKYLFPERFKTGKKEYKNRFFSPVAHFDADQFKQITGVAPQMIALIPENVSGTSASEKEQDFAPRLAWYKGMVSRTTFGGWNWDGDTTKNYPYMFAVNYRSGGQDDPILTYCDQKIGDGVGVLGIGLMRRFFLQRLAVMRYGRRYTTWVNLTLRDVTNWLHREAIIIRGADYRLLQIDKYLPLVDDSTSVLLWKFRNITPEDLAACFPSSTSVMTAPTSLSADDLVSARLLLIATDLPK